VNIHIMIFELRRHVIRWIGITMIVLEEISASIISYDYMSHKNKWPGYLSVRPHYELSKEQCGVWGVHSSGIWHCFTVSHCQG